MLHHLHTFETNGSIWHVLTNKLSIYILRFMLTLECRQDQEIWVNVHHHTGKAYFLILCAFNACNCHVILNGSNFCFSVSIILASFSPYFILRG